ncbi:MAG: hypothetical protein F6K65_13590, partial [Moorea sp. SIO3C2]|nr:hypothetical protein [Moorena sp. SIO3C2]
NFTEEELQDILRYANEHGINPFVLVKLIAQIRKQRIAQAHQRLGQTKQARGQQNEHLKGELMDSDRELVQHI